MDRSVTLRRVSLPLTIVATVMATVALVTDAVASFAGDQGVIAFSRNDEICIVRPDGTGLKNLTGTTSHEIQPSFDARGERIAFIRLNSDLAGDVVLMEADGSTPRVIAVGSYSHPSFSPDGTRIVVARHGEDPGLVVMATDGTAPTRITQPSGDVDRVPEWSPDGTRIVFQRSLVEGAELFTVAADGTGETRLTTNSVPDIDPDWSPDGSAIVFSRDFDIYKMALDGTGVTRLTGDPVATPGPNPPPRRFRSDPVYAPDGSSIAFVRDGEIWTIGPSGGSEKRLTVRAGAYSDLSPDWQSLPVASPSPSPVGRLPAARTAGSSTPPADATPTSGRCIPSGATPGPSPSPTDGTGPARAESSVTISYNGRVFKGEVGSSDARCVGKRRVLLKRKTRDPKDATAGKTRSGDNGGWRLRKGNAQGRYYARVTKVAVGSGDNKVVCARADSKEVIRVIGVQPPS